MCTYDLSVRLMAGQRPEGMGTFVQGSGGKRAKMADPQAQAVAQEDTCSYLFLSLRYFGNCPE